MKKEIQHPDFARMPPIGQLQDFNRKQADMLSSIEYIPLSEYPELAQAVEEIVSLLNRLRREWGAADVSFLPDTVRLVEPSNWLNLANEAKTLSEAGFYDPVSDTVFVKFDPQLYGPASVEKATVTYTIAHELSHKAVPLDDTLFHLEEGLADLNAAAVIERKSLLFPEYGSSVRRAVERYVVDNKPFVEEYEIKDSDILVVLADGNYIPYTRFKQRHIIDALAETDQESFEQIRKLSFLGDNIGVSRTISSRWGERVLELLKDPNSNPKTIVSLIK